MKKDLLFDVLWKLDRKKSVFSTEWVPDEETRLYEPVKGGYRLTVKGSHKGKKYEWSYKALYNGKLHPVRGRKDVDAIEIYKINEVITVGFFKKKVGSVMMPGGPYKRNVKNGGKLLEVEAAGRDAKGRPFYDVLYYNR